MPAWLNRIAGILGILAALACGYQVFWLMMWGLWGAPANPLYPIAQLGSIVLLFGSAPMIAGHRGKAPIFALVGAALLGMFYVPAAIATIAEPTRIGLSYLIALLPPATLFSDVFLVICILARPSQTPARGFPVDDSPRKS